MWINKLNGLGNIKPVVSAIAKQIWYQTLLNTLKYDSFNTFIPLHFYLWQDSSCIFTINYSLYQLFLFQCTWTHATCNTMSLAKFLITPKLCSVRKISSYIDTYSLVKQLLVFSRCGRGRLNRPFIIIQYSVDLILCQSIPISNRKREDHKGEERN